MRTFIKSILFLGIVAFILSSCEEDEFTEKDAMDQLQSIDVELNVTDGGSYNEVVEGATVQLAGDSTTGTKTTDGAGNVTFNDVPVGTNLSVYVHKENFTKAVYNISTLTDSYRENVVTENLKIYSLSGDNIATVKGRLTIETDLTNQEPESIEGEEVRVINRELEGNNSRSFVGTTDEEGKYSIQVPVSPQGDDNLQVEYPSLIEKDQALAVETEDGTFKVDTLPAEFLFSDNYDYTIINDGDPISSAIAEVEAPVGAGSGFELGVEVEPTPFTDHSNIEIISGGSGYTNDVVSFSEDEYGNAAEIEFFVDGDGSIDGYTIYDNNALYASAPELDLSSLDGSGAELGVQFESEYKIFIENRGESYQEIPVVSADYKEYDGNTIVKRFDDNLNAYDNNAYNELSSSSFYPLEDFLEIRGDGSIYPSNSVFDGDTLFFTKGLTEAPTLTVAETSAEQAIVVLGANDQGEVYVDEYDGGSGYDPANPPEISVTSLAGYGSGAELKAEVGTDGSINTINVINAGEGYVWNVNNYDGDGTGYSNGENASFTSNQWIYETDNFIRINNVSAGDVEIRNLYYGTGIREQ